MLAPLIIMLVINGLHHFFKGILTGNTHMLWENPRFMG